MASLATMAGVQFYAKRVQRARKAVAAGNASPEAHAFVEAVPVMEAIAESLSLAASSPPTGRRRAPLGLAASTLPSACWWRSTRGVHQVQV